ncbi:MAG: ABC transporter permease [Bacteroidetes bacterium]|nr:ABC transporter permease [Bacteroidota bacterium]
MQIRTNALVSSVKNFLIEVGGIIDFTVLVFKQFFKKPREHKEMIKQAYYAGNKTFPLIAITGFIMGLVLTLQSRPVLVEFGAESLLPGMISVSIIREIGPVITALLCAGKIGSGYGAEIGSMRVTEQIDAMEVSGINPVSYIVASRIMATTIMVPILVLLADAIAIYGSYVAVNMYSDVNFQLFYNQAYNTLSFKDLIPATFKTIIFGFMIGLIGSYKGYYSKRGTEAVGAAANSAVVTSSLAIFVIDLVVVQVTELF